MASPCSLVVCLALLSAEPDQRPTEIPACAPALPCSGQDRAAQVLDHLPQHEEIKVREHCLRLIVRVLLAAGELRRVQAQAEGEHVEAAYRRDLKQKVKAAVTAVESHRQAPGKTAGKQSEPPLDAEIVIFYFNMLGQEEVRPLLTELSKEGLRLPQDTGK